jgi:hypothetical protein
LDNQAGKTPALPKHLGSKSRDRIDEMAATPTQQANAWPQRWRCFMWMGCRLRSINLEASADRRPIPNRLSPGVRDHNKLNLDRLFANSRNVGHLRCESLQHKASNQLMREAMGKHQGLGDAARNVGKPLQSTAFVVCHRASLLY